MSNYWLYILKDEPRVQGCTLGLSVSPLEQDVDGAKLQTKHYRSWHELSHALTSVGISREMLRSSKAALDADGWYTLREIRLSCEQLQALEFRTD